MHAGLHRDYAKKKELLYRVQQVAPQGCEATWSLAYMLKYNGNLSHDNTVSGEPVEELVLQMQDGLRLYWNGDTRQSLPDPPAEDEEPDYEDQGQKGFSYGTEPRGPYFDTRGRPDILPYEWLRPLCSQTQRLRGRRPRDGTCAPKAEYIFI